MSDDPREDIATQLARDAQRRDEERRRGPLINFGDLQLGGKSSVFGIGFGWPEFLGFLAFGYGVVFGRADEPLLAGAFYALAVWLPLRLFISGSQFLLGLIGPRVRGKKSSAFPQLPLGPSLGRVLALFLAP